MDYHAIVKGFEGRMGPTDCWERCNGAHRCCGRVQLCPLAPGEGPFLADHGVQIGWHPALQCDAYLCLGKETCLGRFRPIVCRQFPLVPSKVGLLVHRGCSELLAMSWRFITDIELMWRQLLSSGPDFQLWASKLEEAAWANEDYVPLWSVQRPFDEGYAAHFGSLARGDLRGRVIDLGWVEAGESVLDVGCGAGEGVKLLRERGCKASGMDVNGSLVDKTLGFVGDVQRIGGIDGMFDVVLSIDVLEHLDDWRVALREMLRVSCGKVIVQVGTLEEVENLMADPTHRVFMPFALWLEGFAAEAEIMAVDWSYTAALLRKRV